MEYCKQYFTIKANYIYYIENSLCGHNSYLKEDFVTLEE